VNNSGTFTVSVVIEGGRACFRRPEFTTDLVSYDVIPPYVAEQILRTIYNPGGGRWSVDRICIINPIRFILDEVDSERGPRRALVLDDVRYVITARFDDLTEDGDRPQHAIEEMLSQTHDIYLGAAAFPGTLRRAEPCEEQQRYWNPQLIDLGWMVKEQKSKVLRFPIFFRARLVNGCIVIGESVLTAT
jgi:CRISPR-associated protein Cas5d